MFQGSFDFIRNMIMENFWALSASGRTKVPLVLSAAFTGCINWLKQDGVTGSGNHPGKGFSGNGYIY